MTISNIYPMWLEEKKLFVKRSTISAYTLMIQKHILPHFGDSLAQNISNQNLQDFIMILIGKGLSNKSAKDISIAVKMLTDYNSEKNGHPLIKYKLRYPVSTERKLDLEVYSSDEQKRILNYILENHTSERLAIALTLCTGMRIGEICALKWSNVDIETKAVSIDSTLQRIYEPEAGHINKHNRQITTKVIIDSAKTSSSNRIVPIAKILIPILKDYKRIMKDDYFFATGTSKYIEPRTMRCHYEKLIKEDVKIGRCIKFHGLRHSFATRLISTGTDPKTTSMILGHSKVEMTMNLYVHPSADNKMDAINKSMKSLFK